MQGRFTVGLLHGEARTAWDDPEHIDPQQRESESWEHVPVVPCDDAAIERVAREVCIVRLGENSRDQAERYLSAAGEAPTDSPTAKDGLSVPPQTGETP